MPKLLRPAAALAAAAALTVAAPAAAFAAPLYNPAAPTDWNGTACAGHTFSHTLPAGSFDDSAALTASITGTSAAVPLPATFLAAQTSYSLKSSASGAATVKLQFPAAASGSYNVSVAEPGSAKVSYGAITVAAPGTASCGTTPAVDPPPVDPPAAATPTSPLAVTGTHVNFAVIWSAGGAVIAGAAFVMIAGVRRQLRRH